ncbi:MAG: hypothetical protein AAFV53_22210 [Myxococcota bacterium]
MDPKALGIAGTREARDSEHHPESVPIIVAFDVTGSMGHIPTMFAQKLLGKLMLMLVERGYVTDPQLLFAAVGDAVVDNAPLQIGQFESGLEMDMWLTRIWLENGGGDAPESYLLPHWFAAHHTAVDSWEKRQKKGYLFSIGDASNKPLDNAQIDRVFGYRPAEAVQDRAVIDAAAAQWEMFHILVSNRGEIPDTLQQHWRDLMGDRILVLHKTESICDVIGVTLGLQEKRLSEADARTTLEEADVSQTDIQAILKTAILKTVG